MTVAIRLQAETSFCVQMLHMSLCSARLVGSRSQESSRTSTKKSRSNERWFHTASSMFLYHECLVVVTICHISLVVGKVVQLCRAYGGLGGQGLLALRLRLPWWSWRPPWRTPSHPSSAIHWWSKSRISWQPMGSLADFCEHRNWQILAKLEWDMKNGWNWQKERLFWKGARFVSRAICRPESRGQLPASSWLAAWKEPSHDHCRLESIRIRWICRTCQLI